MKVETLSKKDINAIGHAFGYYEYAQGEKGLVSAYSSKDAVVSYINGYVEMVLQAGMLYTTGPQQEAFIAYKRCDEKVGLPVVLDTDAKLKSDKYRHLGMELAGVRTCKNGSKLYELIKYPDSTV